MANPAGSSRSIRQDPAGDGTDLHRVVLANRLSGWSVERLATVGSQENQLGWTEVYVLRLAGPGVRRRPVAERRLFDRPLGRGGARSRPSAEAARCRCVLGRHVRPDQAFHRRAWPLPDPEPYFDTDGKRLDVIVENIRWHHAGKAGVSPGPFPGIDYAAALDELPGWEWWSALEGSLEALVVAHDLIGSPLRGELRPGPPASQVEATIRGLGLTPPPELIEFLAWRRSRGPSRQRRPDRLVLAGGWVPSDGGRR